MNAIILAAGMGTRLGKVDKIYPKALVKVGGKELIKYIIDMAYYINVSKIFIVGGCGFNYLKSFIDSYAPEAILIENFDYKKGNLYSLKCALPCINDGSLIFNVDHVFSKDLLNKVEKACNNSNEITVFCDNLKPVEDDQMKISIKENRLSKISKTLKTYDTGYIGLLYCPKAMVDNFKSAVNEVGSKKGGDAVTEDIINYLAPRDKFIKVVDVGGYKWFEVDTPEDLSRAEILLSEFPEKWA